MGASTVLVTGGAGYIGSHTAKALRAAGHRVVIFDNLAAGHRQAALDSPLVVGDIRDVDAVRRAIRQSGATAVMHFAAWLSVPDSVRDPVGYYRNNVDGALATLEAMMHENCRQFVFSSTCAVYGEPTETPLRETHPTRPINAYGQTKLAVEHALPHFERAYGIRSVALRYFNAAGADPDGQLGEDYPTPDGTCLRDYVHVMDLADAHVRALQRLESGGDSSFYNVGTERPSSVRDVVAAVERVTGKTLQRRSSPRREGDPAVLYASAEKIRTELGWRPQRADLDTIVGDAWKWHSTHPNGSEGAVSS